jgi:putative SOS response-associated peptidase YedK
MKLTSFFDEQPLVFSGLWDECLIGDGKLYSCTIITTESKNELQPLHDN